jgi:DNA ligase-4
MEKKYDGERLQIHKKDRKIILFSRGGNNVNNTYGAIIPLLASNIKCDSCILDGEIVVWNNSEKKIERFGTLKPTAKEYLIKGTLTKSDNKIFLILFDILYYNNKSLLDTSFKDRVEILDKIIIDADPIKFPTNETYLQKITREKVCDIEQVNKGITKAIEEGDEGIVLKRINSKYLPGVRDKNWIKLKPYFFEGIGDSLDLVIIGGYYSSTIKRSDYSHFLMGLYDNGKIISFAKVGTGFKFDQLKNINKQLEESWIDHKPDNVELGSEDKPDKFIEPKNSLVFTITAAEITVSDKYKAGYTLRFPVFKNIRYDKDYTDISTLEDIIELDKEYGGFNVKQYEKKHKIKVRKVGKEAIFTRQPADITDVKIISDKLKGKRFVVVSGTDDISKHEIEQLIYSHGGEFVQNPILPSDIVVIGNKTLRAKNYIEDDYKPLIFFEKLLKKIK